MRNVVYGINISIDGCYDHTQFSPDEDIMEYFTQLLRDADVIVYGRKTYELMVPYWPDVAKNQLDRKVDIEFAKAFDAIDKIVFSRSLESVEDKNTRIVRDNLVEELIKLKQQPGKKISIGGVNLPSQLIALGLIDEFYFVIHPMLVGEGKRLLEDTILPEKLNLKLVDSKVFKNGTVGLHYLRGSLN